MEALRRATTWPVEHTSLAVVTPAGVTTSGDPERSYRLASLTKCFTAWAMLVAAEEGTIDLDAALDPTTDRVPEGVTLRHLLAHAAGFVHSARSSSS